MLNQFREINLSWDRATKKIYENIQVASSDESGRKLVVQVVNGSQVEELTNVILNLYWEHKGNKTNGLDKFDPVAGETGVFELYFTTEMLSNIGNLTSNLHLIDATGAVTSEPFSIQVFKGIDNDAVQSSDSFSALTDALHRVVNIELNEGARQEEFEKNELSRANTFKESEAQRKQTFTASETSRSGEFTKSENARQTAFNQSETARDTTFKASEKERSDTFNLNETARQSAEDKRVTAENTRKTNEQTRVDNETARKTVETQRVTAENARKTSETDRKEKETARVAAESARATAESDRATAEAARKSAETTRTSNETTRKNNETARKTAETNRESRFDALVTELESIDVADIRRKTNDQVFSVDANNNVDFKKNVSQSGHRFLFFTESETW